MASEGKSYWIIQIRDYNGVLHPPVYTDDPEVLQEWVEWWTKAPSESCDRFVGGPQGVTEIHFKRATDAQVQREVKPSTFQAFHQVVFEHKSPAAAAESTGLTENAVFIAKHRVLKRLRALNAEFEGEETGA